MSMAPGQEHQPAAAQPKRAANAYIILGVLFVALAAPFSYMLVSTTTWPQAVADGVCVFVAAGVITMYAAILRVPTPSQYRRNRRR